MKCGLSVVEHIVSVEVYLDFCMMRMVSTLLLVSLIFYSCTRGKRSDGSERLMARYKENDQPLPVPGPHDWLSVHQEKGQTFEQYIDFKPITPTAQRKLIYLLPVGNFTIGELKLIDDTQEYLQIFFELTVIVLPTVDDSFIPDSSRRTLADGHTQLLTTAILNDLQRQIPADAIALMAITNADLYPGEGWNYVFGQARTKKRVGVSSVFRYTDGGLDSVNYPTCLGRLIKTSSHEIGHMLSIQHCINALCVMNGVNNLKEADSRPNRLCSECLKKLNWNLRFDVLKRTASLHDYFMREKLTDDKTLALNDLSLMMVLQ